jgi:hypothetical protein
MAQYEERWINGSKYTVPVGTRSDWKPGQAYNTPATKTPAKAASTTRQKADLSGLSGYARDYAEAWNSGKNYEEASQYAGQRSTSKINTQPVSQSTNQSTPKNTDRVLSQLQDTMSRYSFPYEQFLRDLMSQPSTYKAPSESELLTQATQYADLQVSPLLSAIQSRLENARTNYENEKSAIEAAYAGVPARTQSLLDEARRSALESAIARGMGRSGVVDWQTEKLSSPILQQATQSEQEKAAKLAAIANTLAAAQDETSRLRQEAESRRGTLQSARLADLRQQAAQTALQEMAARWGQGFNLAQLANAANMSQQQLLSELIPLLLNG